ncbi:hypothetical protein JKG68_12055 [Microvirga aerilata]|uniref:Uncharacterized protein n=1 Tax=Microvirga aerilata TaxID=670292 RepID=A0A936Z6Y6_9HYPH|nr:hypothetical protein [Microvirga aerilata]MBL0404703.1 hypothetical protein [Microvirga aerilata]
MSDLFEIVAALLAAENHPSSKVREVLSGVRTRISEVEAIVSKANAQMLDPRTDTALASDLRVSSDNALFLVERLKAGLPMLEKALADAEYREEQERRLEAYETASRRMDDVIAALETRYPQLAKEIALLFKVSLETVLEVQVVNANRPDGKPPIAIPAALAGDDPLTLRVSLPGHWRTKSQSLFEGGRSPADLLSLNR